MGKCGGLDLKKINFSRPTVDRLRRNFIKEDANQIREKQKTLLQEFIDTIISIQNYFFLSERIFFTFFVSIKKVIYYKLYFQNMYLTIIFL